MLCQVWGAEEQLNDLRLHPVGPSGVEGEGPQSEWAEEGVESEASLP